MLSWLVGSALFAVEALSVCGSLFVTSISNILSSATIPAESMI